MKINFKKLHAKNKLRNYMENILMLSVNSSLGGTTRNHLKEWVKNQK
jgi:hypothetical protein